MEKIRLCCLGFLFSGCLWCIGFGDLEYELFGNYVGLVSVFFLILLGRQESKNSMFIVRDIDGIFVSSYWDHAIA